MDQSEATSRARAFVLDSFEVDAEPDGVRLIQDDNGVRMWVVFYSAAHFFPEVYAAGGAVEGGEVFVDVDCESGRVSRFILGGE